MKNHTMTIAGIATLVGNAGLSVIRISGEESVSIVDRIFRPKNPKKHLQHVMSHTIHYGFIIDGEKEIDEVLVLVMRAPNTYTREDVVEIDCHGGNMIVQRILETVIKHGARLAEPGEFTKRAFLNGRIDLSQAEAVMDLIQAGNEFALQNSLQHLSGKLREKISGIRQELLRDLAFLEASLDDPEHIELEGFADRLSKHIITWRDSLEKLVLTADQGRMLKEGIRTAIIGKPNAGKSSLLNLLAGEEKAIVTEVAGTTRDVLEETIQLQEGISLILMDTAGIHNTSDKVEQIGVERAKKTIEQADLILFVLDASRKLSDEDYNIAKLATRKPVIILWNKTDLEPVFKREDFKDLKDMVWIPFSAKNAIGLSELTKEIYSMFYKGKISYHDEVLLTRLRHKECVQEAVKSLSILQESLKNGMPEDLFSVDLMDAYEALGKVIGEAVEDDLVNTIFKEFCMGK